MPLTGNDILRTTNPLYAAKRNTPIGSQRISSVSEGPFTEGCAKNFNLLNGLFTGVNMYILARPGGALSHVGSFCAF